MDFSKAVEIILDLEGGLVDNPNDPGGITKYGISISAYPNLGRDGIEKLTKAQAKKIYKKDYWDKARCDDFPPEVRLALFDCAVNQGVLGAIKTLQKSLKVTSDGVIGPVTIAAASKSGNDDIERFLFVRLQNYQKSKNWEIFGEGWSRRLFRIALETGKILAEDANA